MIRLPRLPGTPLRAAAGSRRLVLAAGLPALAICALMCYWLGVLHQHRIQFTDRQMQLQTAAVAEHADVVLRMVDGALKHTAADLHNGRLGLSSAPGLLRLRVSGMPYVRALRLIDADGAVMAVSTATADDRAVELVRAVQGSPAGVAGVVAVVDVRFVTDVFARLAFDPDARVGLYRIDGTRLGGDLDLAPLAGDAPSVLMATLLASGRTELRGPMFVAARQLDGLPLVVVAARDRDAVMASWRHYVAGAVTVTLLAVALLVLLLQRLESERRARLQAQRALAQQQRTHRLESLGRFAGGIAHDFNNVLVAIVGYAELLQQQFAPGSTPAHQIEQVLRAGERGRHLVARILSFSRGGVRERSPVALRPVIDEALDRLSATLPPGVRFERELRAADAVVLGDATQLVDALHNLGANALHAMPAGGTLRVALSRVHVETPRALTHGLLERGDHACIEIEDDGIGMEADVLEHLFEPFFTTRAADGGTGLGLAMVHGAVREAGGAIAVASEPGRGSRFSLYFPLAREPAEDVAPRGAGQAVMVVDDEPALVGLAEELLAGLGYEAVGFHDPREALAAWRAEPQRFDAVVTDQRMPGLSGSALARSLHAAQPRLPILLVSAHAANELDAAAARDPAIVVLHKPLRRDELAAQLTRLLAQPALTA